MDQTIFGTVPPRKLFAKLAVPSLISMFFSSIYMMVDGVFVGSYIGTKALAAINLVFPFIIILFAFGDMIATGSAVKIGIKLGEKNEKEASRIFSVSVITFTAINIVLAVTGGFFSERIINHFVKDTELASLAYRYAKVFILTLPFNAPFFAFDNYMRSCGKAKYSMVTNITVSVLNIVLDAVLIGVFRLEIEYAALASVISISVGTLLSLFPFLRKKLSVCFVRPKIKLKELGEIVFNGSSGFFSLISGSVVEIVINGLLLHLGGSSAVAAYAVVMYIEAAVIPLIYALTDSTAPVVSYNFGAGNMSRVKSFFKITCIAGMTISLFTVAVIMLFPDFLVSLFSPESETSVREIAKKALMLNATAYMFTWINMTVGAFLTAFEKATASIVVTTLSTFVLPIIFIPLFSTLFGLNGVFISPVMSQGITAVVAFFIWKQSYKKVNSMNFKQAD